MKDRTVPGLGEESSSSQAPVWLPWHSWDDKSKGWYTLHLLVQNKPKQTPRKNSVAFLNVSSTLNFDFTVWMDVQGKCWICHILCFSHGHFHLVAITCRGLGTFCLKEMQITFYYSFMWSCFRKVKEINIRDIKLIQAFLFPSAQPF